MAIRQSNKRAFLFLVSKDANDSLFIRDPMGMRTLATKSNPQPMSTFWWWIGKQRLAKQVCQVAHAGGRRLK